MFQVLLDRMTKIDRDESRWELHHRSNRHDSVIAMKSLTIEAEA
jgi:hypothetical protein